MDLKVGQLIREYEIEEKIGEGGMATVYLAHHHMLNSKHAIKVLKIGHRDLHVRMQREGIVQFDLQHPNIIRINDMFEDDGRLVLIMEYINGGSLEDLMMKRDSRRSRRRSIRNRRSTRDGWTISSNAPRSRSGRS